MSVETTRTVTATCGSGDGSTLTITAQSAERTSDAERVEVMITGASGSARSVLISWSDLADLRAGIGLLLDDAQRAEDWTVPEP